MNVIKPALHHVTIKTTRLQEMVDWYMALVGVEVLFQDANNAWTSNDGANHRIAFLSVPGLEEDAEKGKHTGMHHCAFEYAGFEELMSSFERLRDQGILPAFCLDHGMTISLYYEDPEGNYVELQSDRFGDWRQSCHFMRTSVDFQTNPIGAFFDPEKVCRAYREGESFVALQPAIRAGQFAPETIPSMGLPVNARPGSRAGEKVPLAS